MTATHRRGRQGRLECLGLLRLAVVGDPAEQVVLGPVNHSALWSDPKRKPMLVLES